MLLGDSNVFSKEMSVTELVMTCCLLHNLCERHGEAYKEEWTPAPLNLLDVPQPACRDGGVKAMATYATYATPK